MSNCTGRGSCLRQWGCDCNEICNCEVEKLIGGKRECDVWYKHEECPYNCNLIECPNYRYCETKYPQELLDCHNGMCLHCNMSFGKMKYLEEKDDCPVCFENKDMILISCEKHKVCFDCWKQISKTSKIPIKCPMCREGIWDYKRRCKTNK